MSFSSDIKREILDDFSNQNIKNCCINAEKFGEYITVVKHKKEIKENRKEIKEKKMLEKARKKYGTKLENKKDRKNNLKNEQQNDELSKKLSKLTKEQQDALLKLLER